MVPYGFKAILLIYILYQKFDCSYSVKDVSEEKVICILKMGYYFKHVFPRKLSIFYDGNLTKEICAKNAIKELKDHGEDYDYKRVGLFEGAQEEYYLSFRDSLIISSNIQGPSQYCFNKYKGFISIFDKKQKHTLRLDCMDELKGFPKTPKDALEYAFYKVAMEDFKGIDGKGYMQHMIDNVQVSEYHGKDYDRIYEESFCIFEIGKYFHHQFRTHTTFGFIGVTKKICATNAIKKLKCYGEKYEFKKIRFPYQDEYYMLFRNNLHPNQIEEPEKYCGTKYHDSKKQCLKELKGFPNTPVGALEHAFYNVVWDDFTGENGKNYMQHILDNFGISENVAEPNFFCVDRVFKDFLEHRDKYEPIEEPIEE